MTITVVRELAELQAYLERHGGAGAFIPTMGALHDGHGELIRHARRDTKSPVVVSIFVNPLQFGPNEDLERYPRTPEEDLALTQAWGADCVWFPEAAHLTPPNLQVTVDPGAMATVLCGADRPGHFRGVATIVMKLFQLVRPRRAYFGWKDAQQFLILRRMVEDLNIPVDLVAVETVREPDGLAKSSRNRYLGAESRQDAAGIYGALEEVRGWAQRAGGRVSPEEASLRLIQALQCLRCAEQIQYARCVSMGDLKVPVETVPGETLLAVAVRYPEARLIDNVRW
jgi:pantoate--beta-alanine ligase